MNNGCLLFRVSPHILILLNTNDGNNHPPSHRLHSNLQTWPLELHQSQAHEIISTVLVIKVKIINSLIRNPETDWYHLIKQSQRKPGTNEQVINLEQLRGKSLRNKESLIAPCSRASTSCIREESISFSRNKPKWIRIRWCNNNSI